MDEVIWIEILARQREAVTRQRASGPVIAVGRAYDNDIVLDDPHVAPHHLRLSRREDGRWAAEDLGTINGMRVAGARHDSAALDDDTVVYIGHTGIRLRSAACPVPPELPLSRTKPRWPVALGCLIVLLAFAMLESWLSNTGETKLINYLEPPIELAILIAIWTSAWSVMSRILTGNAQYGHHLLIASAGLLIYTICSWLASIGAYALSMPVLAACDFILAWLTGAAVCFAHLRALGSSRLTIKAVCVLALAGLGIGVQSLNLSDERANTGQPSATVLKKLAPPALRLVPPQLESAFFGDATRLKTSLDQARTDTLPPGSGDNDDD